MNYFALWLPGITLTGIPRSSIAIFSTSIRRNKELVKRFLPYGFFSLAIFILTTLCFARSVEPTSAVSHSIRLGIIGDSSSDEYRADDNRGGDTQWAETTLVWSELLQRYRGFDLGTWAVRPEPRRTGFEYNWARTGAESHDLITSEAYTGIAQQAADGELDVIYFSIGTNDFAYYGDGAAIYEGTLAGRALQQKINGVVSDIITSLETILTADPDIKVIFTTIGDMGNIPSWQSAFPDPVKRQRVTEAINQANAGLVAFAETHPQITIFYSEEIVEALFSHVDANGNLVIEGELIALTSSGDEPHHAILSDNIHAGTVLNGILANIILDKINTVLDTTIPNFSDSEILANAGITSG